MIQALIVDDEPLHIQGLVRHIDWERLGYAEPLTSESGQEALDILSVTNIDVLISDVSMPGMTGIELLAKCRTDYPHLQSLQVLIISGYDEFEFVQEAIHYGAKAYVLKPVSEAEVEEKLFAFGESIKKKVQADNEMSKLREKILDSQDVLHERFVNDMVEGRMQEELYTKSWIKILDLPTEPWHIRLFVFMYDRLQLTNSEDPQQRIVISDGLLRAVKIWFSGLSNIFIGKTRSEEVILFQINASPSDRALADKQMYYIQDVIEQQYKTTISIGVSRECQELEVASQLYKEVKHMLMAARARGVNQICYFDLDEAIIYHDSQINEEDIPAIVDMIKSGESERVIGLFHHVFDLLVVRREVPFSYVQALGMNLISELARRLNSGEQSENEANIRMWQRMINCTNITEVREIVLDNLIRYEQFINKERKKLQHNLIRKIVSHIEENLQANITVKQLAEEFHVNVSYLSVLFKKETGQTPSEFIQEKRINKAKILLQDPNIKVYEVAEQVGFQTAAYFAYLFKKVTGTTPQDFRDYYSK